MLTLPMSFSRPVVLGLVGMFFGAVLAPAAAAEDREAAERVLRRAAEAARQLETLTANARVYGEGSDMLTATMPSGEGEIRLRRRDGEEEEAEWHARVTGEGRHRRDDDAMKFDIVTGPNLVVWVEHERERVVERRPGAGAGGQANSIARLMAFEDMTGAEPYAADLAGTSLELEDSVEVNGVMCDVVHVERERVEGRRPSVRDFSPTAVRWYFGQEDHLPRRVERITDAGIVKLTLITELSDVRVNPSLNDDAFEIATPEGYRRDEMPAGRTPATRVTPERTERPTPAERERREEAEEGNGRPQAPNFELPRPDGEVVSLESMRDSVAVLYFWGTWCIPCRAFSPLVSEMAETFEDKPVRVLGLATREPEPGLAEDYMRERGFKHELLLDADRVARSYRVRVYPTFYIIGFDGELIGTEQLDREERPAETMARIEETIRSYLAERGAE